MTCKLKEDEIRELQKSLKNVSRLCWELSTARSSHLFLQQEEMDHRFTELNTCADALRREVSVLQVELAKAVTELDLSGKVVSHLEDAKSTLDAEHSSLRAVLMDSSRGNVELLSAVETLKADRKAFSTQRDDHERELRRTIADLQQRLESAVADHMKSKAIADSKIAELETKLVAESERLKSFPSRYEGGGQLVSVFGYQVLCSVSPNSFLTRSLF